MGHCHPFTPDIFKLDRREMQVFAIGFSWLRKGKRLAGGLDKISVLIEFVDCVYDHP